MKLSLVMRHPESWGNPGSVPAGVGPSDFTGAKIAALYGRNCQSEGAKIPPSNEIHLQQSASAPEPCSEQGAALPQNNTVLL